MLLGVTGSGKTFTMANIIETGAKADFSQYPTTKPLRHSFAVNSKPFFPTMRSNISLAITITTNRKLMFLLRIPILKKIRILMKKFEKLRHSATAALAERRDVVIVASVSCIYGLGSPIDYEEQVLSLRPGMEKSRGDILRKLVDIQYARNDMAFARGNFRVRGDVIDIYPAGTEHAIRVELFGDEVEVIKELNPVTGEIQAIRNHVSIFPASHYVTSKENMERAVKTIEEELDERLIWFRDRGKLLEAQRLEQRTRYDLELLREIGSCKGIENYSRHINGLAAGARPYTLIRLFPR